MKTVIYILSGLIILFSSCDTSNSNIRFGGLNHKEYNSKYADGISVYQNKITITGSAKHIKQDYGIRSPFILILDSLLNVVNFEYYQTKTTASNVRLKPLSIDEYLFSYYSANSLVNQEEDVTIKVLDETGSDSWLIKYGKRTRIKDIAVFDNSTFATLNYERSTQEIGLRPFKNFIDTKDVRIAEGQENNIPTDLKLLHEDQLILSGIGDGFHYLDGHSYKNPHAYGFIVKLDNEGNELDRYIHKKSGHVFIYDMIINQNKIFFVGNQQSKNTGMDMIFCQLDLDLNIISEKTFLNKGIQEANKIIYADDSFYIYGTSESLENNKMMLQLVRVDESGNIIWEKTYGKTGATNSAVDMLFYDSHIFLLSNSKESRTSDNISYLQKISITGDIKAQMDFF